ncbi:LTA synthase family protein [Ohtaekwangia koreensis]|uniref:Phosphoglycerol transferase MdoB n=1 Tax=Ohtaekwangia koreensis TaxID=688867 RepID=A0A1T5M2P5_9BACT|nr:LTA synthase family protein [Ohtaekwangia koreensis]SKC82531.1 Phosphoglycerol transferase MdoB [Ohtaekwangia koreensis]
MRNLFQGLKLQGNIYVVLVLRLLLAMALYTLCRIGFYFFNQSYFSGLDFGDFLRLFLGGLRFDLTAILYTNSLIILLTILPLQIRFHRVYQQALKWLFFVFNGIALATNVSDFIYFRFTGRRTTADVFKQFENEGNLGGLWLRFIWDYWYAVLFLIALIVVMVWLYNKIKVQGPMLKNKIVFYSTGVLMMLPIIYLVIGGMRGGFRHSTRPITLSNAGEYVKDSKEISLVLNTPFALLRTMGKTKIQKLDYFKEEQLGTIYTPIHIPVDTVAFRPDNVVVIILESFSKEFFGAFNKEKENGTYKGYTPFLDSLIQHSLTFNYSFANGRKSIDGLPSVLSSIPSLGVPYFLSPYAGNKINSLASLLKPKGYHTSFFHGAPNGSMGFQAFMNLAGVDHYYGMTEYANNDDSDGMWGIWDDKFFNFYADQLNGFPQPFMSSIFSVSSHHPFKVPEEYEGKFKGGPLVIHKCIEYTDYSLKKFFAKASTMPWFKNTLFVITADHTSSEIEFPESRTAWGFYSVPVIFYKPDHSLADSSDQLIQQIDIMPSILGNLHFNSPYVAFGRDIFRETIKPLAFNYKDNVYQLFEGDYLLQFDGIKTVALYNFKTDKLLEHNLIDTQRDILGPMENTMKAVLQQYNNRLVEDRFTIKDVTPQ